MGLEFIQKIKGKVVTFETDADNNMVATIEINQSFPMPPHNQGKNHLISMGQHLDIPAGTGFNFRDMGYYAIEHFPDLDKKESVR